MTIDIKDCKNLTDLLLGPIRQRPGMYLGEPKISRLVNFILGYNMGYYIAKHSDTVTDNFSGENGFLEWFYKKHKLKQTNSWMTPFLEESNQDESIALELFFKYLDQYNTEISGISTPNISER